MLAHNIKKGLGIHQEQEHLQANTYIQLNCEKTTRIGFKKVKSWQQYDSKTLRKFKEGYTLELRIFAEYFDRIVDLKAHLFFAAFILPKKGDFFVM